MLTFSQLGLRRGTRELLRDVTCTIHAGQKVGLTGANGAGKSSLFALIRGELQPDTGELSMPAQTVIAHVAQETPPVDTPGIEYVIDGDAELRRLQREIRGCAQGERLGHLYAELEAIEGYSARSRAGRLMQGLGFTAEQEQTPVRALSGGWRMRLNLAQALMCRSDLLLLDEPTNHLDLDAVIWLEQWLSDYPGTLLLISHDRDFLDRIATHIAHIEQQRLTVYRGNYSAFELRRAEQLATQQAAYERQQREVAHMHRFVERFRAKATKARQAQSRLKALERMEVIAPAHVDSQFRFSFPPAADLPSPLITLDEVEVGYGGTRVLRDLRLSIDAGDRIGLLGHNGAGKSTLIKLLAGRLQPLSGARREGRRLNIGYFAQHQLDQLDGRASALQHLERMDRETSQQALRDFLGGFAFRDEMATSSVERFSGGEKARLVLAMIVYRCPDLLLLDEPTNHLDLDMRLALSVALQGYEGAMILVSHDRHLLRSVTDRLLLVHEGRVSPFDGDLDDYRIWLAAERQRASEPARASTEQTSAPSRKEQRQQAAEIRRHLQPMRRRVSDLERELERLSGERDRLHDRLADASIYASDNKAKLEEVMGAQARISRELQAVESQWLAASEELEALSARYNFSTGA
jgi:ATP-binding cassette subfamily F protein 3